jgi:hypothetical protein
MRIPGSQVSISTHTFSKFKLKWKDVELWVDIIYISHALVVT